MVLYSNQGFRFWSVTGLSKIKKVPVYLKYNAFKRGELGIMNRQDGIFELITHESSSFENHPEVLNIQIRYQYVCERTSVLCKC